MTARGAPVSAPEQIRVPLPGQTGQRERLLVDGRRGNGVDTPGQRIGHGRDDRVVGGAARRRRQHARRERRELGRRRRSVDHRPADLAHARIVSGFASDLGPDAGGIAGRDGDDGHSEVVNGEL